MLKEVLVVGKESVGKSQLIASLSGASVYASNFRGSTVACEAFRARDYLLIDTPGIQRSSDTVAMREAFSRLNETDTVLFVAPASHLAEDLGDLLPLLQGKQGAVAVTFMDRMDDAARERWKSLGRASAIPFVFLDARTLSKDDKEKCHAALSQRVSFTTAMKRPLIQQFSVPRREPLSNASSPQAKWAAASLALMCLVLPGWVVVWLANSMAEKADPIVRATLNPLVLRFNYPVLTGDYGLLTMGPLLFVWAVPVVVLYALVLGHIRPAASSKFLANAWTRSFVRLG